MSLLVACVAALSPSPTYEPSDVVAYYRIPANTYANDTVLFEMDASAVLAAPAIALVRIDMGNAPYTSQVTSPASAAATGVVPSPFLAIPYLDDTAGQAVVAFQVTGVDDPHRSAFGVSVDVSPIRTLHLGAGTGEHLLSGDTRPYVAYTLVVSAPDVLRYPALLQLVNEGSEHDRCSFTAASVRLVQNAVPFDRLQQQPTPFVGVYEENGEGADELAISLCLHDASFLGRYYVGIGWRQSNWQDDSLSASNFAAYYNVAARIDYPLDISSDMTRHVVHSVLLYYHESAAFFITVPPQTAYPVYVRLKLVHMGTSIMVSKGRVLPTPESHMLSNTQEPEDCQGPSRVHVGNDSPLLSNSTTFETVLVQNASDAHDISVLLTNYVYATDVDCSTRRRAWLEIEPVQRAVPIQTSTCTTLELRVRDAKYFELTLTDAVIAAAKKRSQAGNLTVSIAVLHPEAQAAEFMPYVLIAKGLLPSVYEDRLGVSPDHIIVGPTSSIPISSLVAATYYIAIVGSVRPEFDEFWAAETLCTEAVNHLESLGRAVPVSLSVDLGSDSCSGSGRCERGECVCQVGTIGQACQLACPVSTTGQICGGRGICAVAPGSDGTRASCACFDDQTGSLCEATSWFASHSGVAFASAIIALLALLVGCLLIAFKCFDCYQNRKRDSQGFASL